MAFLRNIVTGLRSLFRKEQVDRELDEELRAYQEMAAEEKVKDGMSRKEALRAVRLERGSLQLTKETVRSAGWESLAAWSLAGSVSNFYGMMRPAPIPATSRCGACAPPLSAA